MPEASVIIEVERLSKVYGSLPALRGINFSVRRGEFLVLLGANGSGKSTLLRLLSGLGKPTAGLIRVGRLGDAGRGDGGAGADRPDYASTAAV